MDAIALNRARWRLVMPEEMHARLFSHLFPGDQDEHGAIVAAGTHVLPDGRVRLLARELHLAIDGQDYVAGQRGYRMLRAQFIMSRIVACRDERLVYLAIHNHGGGDHVGFSGDDLRSHERGYPPPSTELIKRIRDVLIGRIEHVDAGETVLAERMLEQLVQRWRTVQPPIYGNFGPAPQETPLMYPAGSEPRAIWSNRSKPTPSSMRNVDAGCDAEVILQFPEP